jgi:hypothetical protein
MPIRAGVADVEGRVSECFDNFNLKLTFFQNSQTTVYFTSRAVLSVDQQSSL